MSPQERREKSERLLASMGVHINPHLPVIESESETKVRTAEEIARRAICLTAVVSRALGDPKTFLIDYLKKKSCLELLTEQEQEFLNKARITKKDKIKFSWQVEALRVLLWSIGLAKIEPLTFTQCEPHSDVFDNCSSASNDGSPFINKAKVLSISEILDMSDLIYRAHWATRQRSLDSSTNIGALEPGVVLEYHRAINWVTCYENLDWDEVTTDT